LINLSLPLLLTALLIGFSVSLFQAVSAIQEQTLSSVPKMIGVFAIIMLIGPWMLNSVLDLFRYIKTNIPVFLIR